MAIVAAELKLYKSEIMNDTISNGGVMSINEVVSGVKNAVFPDVSQDERTNGLTDPRYRKIWCKVANDDDLSLVNAVIHYKTHTPAGDYLELFDGDGLPTQNDIIGTERKYGCGALQTGISIGGSTLDVTIEHTDQVIFVNADKIFISNGTDEEYFTNVTISKVGTTVSITLDTGNVFANDYSSSDTFVGSVFEVATVEAEHDTMTFSAGLTYDDTGANAIVVDNIAGVEDTWIGTVKNDTDTFTLVGTKTGALADGSFLTDYAPENADFSNKPYFTLKTLAWGGTRAENDTFTLVTRPAAHPVWLAENVPASTDSYSGNTADIRFGGESA